MALPLVAAAIAGLAAVAGQLVMKALVGLGVGAVSYVGITALMDALVLDVQNALFSLSPDVLALIGVFNVDRVLSLIFSAIAARIALAGVNAVAGGLRRFQ